MSHAEQVRLLIRGGASLIQLREKTASPAEFYREAVEAVRVAHSHNVKIVINDRVDIAIAAGADGVHLGQEDLPPDDARRLLGTDAIIGFSTHSEDQARSALKLPIDYVAFGPIFSTETKPDHDPVVGLNLLSAVAKIVGDLPLVAIGGIGRANIQSVIGCGADSAAIISGLFAGPRSISENLFEMLEAANIV